MSGSIPELIRKKRDGEELGEDEMRTFVQHTAAGTAQQCQIGAMLMAMYIRGLTERETVHLTHALMKSGDALTWPEEWQSLLVDKHSTGGVGDKTSLPLAPALAACGLKVPMLSGRGLEFTGGTLDKLEAIPGFTVQLEATQMERALREAGCFIAGQTDSLVPADKVLYTLRDVTATVDSDPLTVASIVAKKAVEGVSALVMDIKVGRAALFQTEQRARQLAQQFVRVAEGLGVRTTVVFSRMDAPLGRAVGNALEVAETLDYLRGVAECPDLAELVTNLGGELLCMKGLAGSLSEGQAAVAEAVKSGRALRHFEAMLRCQGVEAAAAHQLCHGDMWAVLPRVPPAAVTHLASPQTGYVSDVCALEIARVCQALGAGRSRTGEALDPRVGVLLLRVPGEQLQRGEPWLEVHHAGDSLDPALTDRLQAALSLADSPPLLQSRVIGTL